VAITLFASDGTGGNKTSESQTTITLSASALAVNDVVLILMAADNAGTSGASSVTGTAPIVGGSSAGSITWETLRVAHRTAGSAANDGATLYVQSGKVTGALAANSTALWQWNFATLAKAWRVLIIRGATPTVLGFGTSLGNGGSVSAAPSGYTPASGDIAIGAVAVESATAITTADTDTTNGSWSSVLAASSAGSGGDGTKMSLGIQYKVVTAGGAQVWNPSVTVTDFGGAYLGLAPGAPAVTVTAVLTGGGVTTSTRSSARSRPSTVATGGGVVARTAAKAASSVAATTGGGVVTHVYNRLEAHFGSASLSGAGAVVPAGAKAASQAGIATGGGAAVVAFGGAHALAQVLTGAGVVTRVASKGAFYDRSFPIVAVDAIANKFSIGGNQTLRFPAFGFFTVTGSTGNDGSYVAGTVSYTGGQTHITIFGGDFSSTVADGQLNVVANVATGAGRVLSTRRKDASGVAAVAGGGVVAATATASSGAEEHEGTALLTGGGAVVGTQVHGGTASPALAITQVDTANDIFIVEGDQFGLGPGGFATSARIVVTGHPTHDGVYTSVLVEYSDGLNVTAFWVGTNLTDSTVAGTVSGYRTPHLIASGSVSVVASASTAATAVVSVTGAGAVAAVASRQAVTTQVLVGAGAVVSAAASQRVRALTVAGAGVLVPVAISARGVAVAGTGGGVVAYVAEAEETTVLARSYAILV